MVSGVLTVTDSIMPPVFRFVITTALFLSALFSGAPSVERPRLRELGVSPGIFKPGRHNAITDVAGVLVGHRTLVKDDAVRTGVTAILPHDGNLFRSKVPAAVFVGNGFGKAAGFLQVQELGNLETPVVLTNTLAVGTAVEAVVGWTLARPGNEEVRSVNAVVGETNDGYINDIRGRHVTREDVRMAIEAASSGPVPEGSIGARPMRPFHRATWSAWRSARSSVEAIPLEPLREIQTSSR